MDWKLGGLIAALTLAGCQASAPQAVATGAAAPGGPEPDPIVAVALEQMRHQVASDIELTVDQSQVVVVSRGGFLHACGEAVLNRPGEAGHPLTLDHARQRFVTTLNTSGNGWTTFDGSSVPEGRAEFEREWESKCRQG